MTERPFPQTPAPGLTTAVQFGCDGRWWSESQMHDYIRADRAAQGDAVRKILSGLLDIAEHAPDWRTKDYACAACVPESSIVKPGFHCAIHAARELLAKEKQV